MVGHAQEAYWQQQVNFKIDVALNDTEHTLNGFARIQYRDNHSPDTLSFIWIHCGRMPIAPTVPHFLINYCRMEERILFCQQQTDRLYQPP